MMHPKQIAETIEAQPFDARVTIVNLEGEFDIAERSRLLDAFAVTTNSAVIIVDFEKTRYVDSSVLECLVTLERTVAERDAKLVLISLRPEIRRIFEVCGLERLFDIRSNLGDAASELGAEPAAVRTLSLISGPAVAFEAYETSRRDEP
jgi:anti-sigma B factor antagonist